MYVPDHFAMTDEQAAALLSTALVGDLVTAGPDGLDATFLPFVYEPDQRRILMHLTRVNPQWRHEGPAMLLVHGHNHVVSADWQPHGSVGTLNYETIHVHGSLVAHDDEAFLRDVVAKTAARTERSWRVEQVDPTALSRMLRASVGVELRIERIVGKAKLSQNKRPDTLRTIIDGLMESGHDDEARLLLERSMPHAVAREELITGLRAAHDASTGSEPSR